MNESVSYSQNVTEYNSLGMYGSSTLHAKNLDVLKVKRNQLINKARLKGNIELFVFGKIIETKKMTLDDTDDMFQLTDTITNDRVTQETKNKAGKLKRFQDRILKLKDLQKRGKFKTIKRY